MRWLVAGLLGFYAFGSFGMVVEDYKLYRMLLPESKMAAAMGLASVAGAAAVLTGWGM